MASTTAVIRGVSVDDGGEHTGEPAGILFDCEWVRDIGPPGLAAPDGAEPVDAKGMLIHPGLINGDTRGAGNMGQGRRRSVVSGAAAGGRTLDRRQSHARRCLSQHADPRGGDLQRFVAAGKTASSERDPTADGGPRPVQRHSERTPALPRQ